MSIPTRQLGRTGVETTIMGLGGEGILRTFGHDEEAYRLINRALDLGVAYCESARAYAGSESYYGKALGERRKDIFLTSKSHARDKRGALDHLNETLANMRTDYIDLWQVHDMRTEDDINRVFGPGGALEAFVEAKEKGAARFIGVTGHHDPKILQRCVEMYDFDTVLLPINPAEPHYNSFIHTVMPIAASKGMGVIAMKVYLHGFVSRLPGYDNMAPFFQFALSHGVSTAVIGCDTVEQLEQNVEFASSFDPMSSESMSRLISEMRPYARSIMYYKP